MSSSQQQGSGGFGATSLFVPGRSNDWWPSDLRHPSGTGSQNHVRYAYFAQARRLVIDVNRHGVRHAGSPDRAVAGVVVVEPQRRAVAGGSGPRAGHLRHHREARRPKAKGILSDDEFQTRKAELLGRL